MMRHVAQLIHGDAGHDELPGKGAGSGPETSGKVIRWAHRYDLIVQLLLLGRAGSFRRACAALAGIRPGDRVLDVGCGTGELTLAAAALAGPQGEAQGIDASPEMIGVARSKAMPSGTRAEFREGLVERIPFPDSHFDVVLSSLMMHHLPGELKQAGLAEMSRVLKPGGRLLIVDFKRSDGRHSHNPATLLLHRNLETGVQDLVPLVAEAGFAEIETGNTGFGPVGYVRARRAG